MIELIVFDWDGTLMDSEARIVHAMQRAFAEAGEPPPDVAAVRDIIGRELAAAVGALAPALDAARVRHIAAAYRRQFALARAIPSPLFADARATLATFEARGTLLAVATGKSRGGLECAMREAGIEGFFVTTRTADDGAPKPHPEILCDILAELEVSPGRALMVGDTELDLTMARAAEVHAAAVTYGAHPRHRLMQCRPALVVDALGELPDAVDRLSLTLNP